MPGFGAALTSTKNPRIKFARSLLRWNSRQRERAFLVEGATLLADALRLGAVPEVVFVDERRFEGRYERLAYDAFDRGAQVFQTSADAFGSLVSTESPQGIIALFRFPDLEVSVPPTENALVLVLDELSDPGNVGTLIRSSMGAGVHAIYLSAGSVDPFSPKVVRSGMAAHFRLPISSFAWTELPESIRSCDRIYICEVNGQLDYDSAKLADSVAIIIGNESHGVSDAARRHATSTISIPLASELESLNAAVAGSIVLFEAARHRRAQTLRAQA